MTIINKQIKKLYIFANLLVSMNIKFYKKSELAFKIIVMTKQRKHPKGLMVLFFTEMWERFGFYLLIGIFSLYMIEGKDSSFPGMGFSSLKASDIYGSYLALVYLTPFIGGLLADRYLGFRLSITIGGILFSSGYFLLSINNETTFFIALGLIILGNGLFKPNISALVGKIYDADPKYKDLKDSGYNIFYMGINIGAFICNFIAAFLRLKYGWGWAFAAAGFGMLIGVIWFWVGQMKATDIKQVDKVSPPTDKDIPMVKILYTLFLPAIAAAFIGWIIPDNIFGSDSTDAFLLFSAVVVLFYINILRKAEKHEKEPIKALLAVFGAVVVFWAIFHQNGAALTFWAQNNTNRELKPATEKVLSTLKLTETVSTAPRIYEVSGLHGEFKEYKIGPSYYFDNISEDKIQNLKSGIENVPADIENIYTSQYVLNTQQNFENKINSPTGKETTEEISDLKTKYSKWSEYKDVWLNDIGVSNVEQLSWENVPNEKKAEWKALKLVPTELFQSVNPGFIVLFTPLVVGFFNFLTRRRKKGPVSTPAKIGWGMVITALSAIVMIFAVIASENEAVKASAGWLFGTYAVITVGELCLSPMGLSLVSKLSPPRITALMMGGWFLSTSIGNKLSGVLSGMWGIYDNKSLFFLTNTLLAGISVILIFSMLPWLNRVMKKYTEDEPTLQEEISEIE